MADEKRRKDMEKEYEDVRVEIRCVVLVGHREGRGMGEVRERERQRRR